MTDLIGQQFGPYRLVRTLAQGTFADIYLAEYHSPPNAIVVIKVLHIQLVGDDAEDFLTSAQVLARLRHPHLVQVLDFGLENSTPFLVMTYAPNGSLRQLHPKRTQLPLATIVAYVRQIADALQYIHDQKLIHRDIKPHNMLLGPNHEVLLSDFSIAIGSPEMGYHLRKVAGFEGTILYAAPEQVHGRARIASDQYSLGIVVYEWLTGHWPFRGSVSEIATQHVLTPPPSLVEQLPTLSPAVEQVVFKALAKEPEQRFESVQDFAKALEQASRLEQPGSSPLPPKPPDTLPALSVPSEFASPTTLTTYRGHTDRVRTVAWTPDSPSISGLKSYIASSSLDETIQLWDAATGETLLTYRSNSLQGPTLAWSSNGQYIASTSGLSSEFVQIWEATTGQEAFPANPIYEGHTETVHALAWSPDGQSMASGSEDKTVHVWDTATKRTLFTYRGHSLAVKAMSWSPTGERLASGSEDKTVRVWDALTGGNLLVYYGHRDKVNAVAWSPDRMRIASASDDQTVQIWDASTGYKVLTYSGHAGSVTALAWSPDGTKLASGGLDETVQVWDATTGKHIATYRGHPDWVSSVAWSPAGTRVASGSWDKTVQVWEVV